MELVVKRYNISYHPNPNRRSKLLECKPIHDYSFFLYDVQRRLDCGDLLETAMQNSIDYCIEHDVMKDFLIEHEKEVLEMYSSSRMERAAREAAMEDGRIEGRIEGQTEERKVGIKALIASAKKFSASPAQTIEQLMEQYSLTKDEAQAAVQANW